MDLIELTHKDILQILPDRNAESHKGTFGKILLICGSLGYTGSAALAAMGALRCGAGLVYLCVPDRIYDIEAAKLTEPIVIPVTDCNGMWCKDSLSKILELLPQMDAVLIGCGMGWNEGTKVVVESVLNIYSGTVVLDADGINALDGNIDILRGRTGTTILTPHAVEFQRLGGVLTDDRVSSAVDFANRSQSVVLLKGHKTVITDGTTVYINPTGNPGMAVGGSGDVLAGMVTVLVGQGLTPIEAAACGAWLHGAAGDLCAKEIGQYGMLPSDMLKVLPRLLK